MTPVHFNWFPTNITEQNEQNSSINDKNFKIFEPCTNMKKNENQMNFSSGSGTCLNLHTYCKKEKKLKKQKEKTNSKCIKV